METNPNSGPNPDPPVPAFDDRFERIVGFTLQWETVRGKDGQVLTTRHPNDPGGATRYGIDQRSHPEVSIDHLTESQAREIYRRRYWMTTGAATLPSPVGEAVFDIAVLQGPGTAIRLLQRAVGVNSDGRIGPVTRSAVDRLGAMGAANLLIGLAEDRLSDLPRHNPRLSVFRRGWLRRMASLRQYLDVPSR